MLVIVVGLLSILVIKKGFTLYKLETIAKRNKENVNAQIQEDIKTTENQADQDSNQTPNQEQKDLVDKSGVESNVLNILNTEHQDNDYDSEVPVDNVDPKLLKVSDRDKSVVNWLDLGILFTIFL